METVTVLEFLNRINVHLDLPANVLDIQLANPFRISSEYMVSIDSGKTVISFEKVQYIFDISNQSAILTISNEARTYSFDENGEIASLEN